MKIIRTRHGLRFTEHGVVISELRTTPGPTHSVFDVLAALVAVLKPAGRIGVLGFAAGGIVAPLRALKVNTRIHSVDLDRTGYDAFCRHCAIWVPFVKWDQADAGDWLRRQRYQFDLLLDDLSVPVDGDVFKPAASWNVLPELIRRRLKPGGVAIFNLLPPSPPDCWSVVLRRMLARFETARIIDLDEFENRILVAGSVLPSARSLGASVRDALERIHSRQSRRLRLRNLHFTHAQKP